MPEHGMVFDMVETSEEWFDSWRGAEGLEGGAWYTHTSYADCSGRYSRYHYHRQQKESLVDLMLFE